MSEPLPSPIARLTTALSAIQRAVEPWYMQDRPPGTVYRDEMAVLAAFPAINGAYAIPSEPYTVAQPSSDGGSCAADGMGNGSDDSAGERGTPSPQGTILRSFDDAIASIPGVGPLVRPILGPTWTSELRRLLIVVRSAVETSGALLLDHLRIPFLHGMDRLWRAENTLRTLDYDSSLPTATVETKPLEWSKPMTRKEARRRYGGVSQGALEALLKEHGVRKVNRQTIRVRLDTMDLATRERFETGG